MAFTLSKLKRGRVIIGMSLLYAYVMSYLHISQAAAQAIVAMQLSPWVLLATILALVIALGFFLPPVSIILMTAPIILPPLKAAGFDLVWFGVVMTITMEMGLIHPPVGLNIFVIKNIAPDIPLKDIIWGTLPFVILMGVAIVLLCLVPGIALWLPDLLLGAARGMQDLGVAMFDIEGGEPLLRLPRLLNLLRAIDDRSELWINTTGAGLTPEGLRELKAARLFGVMISVHSPSPAAHDALTGVPGSFETACGAARFFRAAGVAVAVNSVLSEGELRAGGLERLMDLARELGADFVQLIHPKPAGNWLGRKENMQQDPAVIEQVRALHRRYNSSPGGYPCLVSQVLEEQETRLGCTAGGVDRFYLNAYGEVQPCEFLNLSFGNLREEPLRVIMQRMRAYFPEPCSDWLCCTQSGEIERLFREQKLERTPLPWPVTKALVEGWTRGRPTPLYKKLGIYKR